MPDIFFYENLPRKRNLDLHIQRIHTPSGHNDTDNDAEKTLPPQPLLYSTKMMKNGKECLVFATGNKINFTSTDQLVFKNGTIQTLPFSCEGVHGFGTRLLIYGSNECIIREDPCSVNDVIHIVGFEGNIKETKWIDNDLFYVFTDIGIYLYDVNTCLNAHSKSVL